MVEYSEEEMNEMASSIQQQEFAYYEQEFADYEESFTIFQTTYLGNNA
jgi:hypothetical protein